MPRARQPREARLDEHPAQPLALPLRCDAHGVELADVGLDLEPAETDQVVAVPQQQKIVRIEPLLRLARIEIALGELARPSDARRRPPRSRPATRRRRCRAGKAATVAFPLRDARWRSLLRDRVRISKVGP